MLKLLVRHKLAFPLQLGFSVLFRSFILQFYFALFKLRLFSMLKNESPIFSLAKYSTYTRFFLFACYAGLFASLLSACSTSPKFSSAQHNQQRTMQEQVQLTGRISIQYQQREQTETISTSFDWQQTPQALTITLSSPLGQTIATVQQNAQGAVLTQAKQEPRIAPDIEQLLAENLGWTIPVAGLKGWLQGFDIQKNGTFVAVPVQDYFQVQSQGWQLQFISWQEDAGAIRPKRIDLQRYTEELGEVKIKIIIEPSAQ